MIKQKRYEMIMELVDKMRIVPIDDFCEKLGVSRATVRRDLIYMDEANMLKRTHGGAVSLVRQALEDMPVSMRQRMYKEEKGRIADVAAGMIRDGSTIFIGSGTTLRELALRLRDFRKLTVLTNDIDVAYDISQRTSNDLIVAGGILKQPTATLIGSITEDILRDLHVETAFLSADSAKPKTGFMDKNINEVMIKRLVIKNSTKSVMLCDQSKFSANAFATICPFSGVDLTITNGEMDPKLEHELQEEGMTLQFA